MRISDSNRPGGWRHFGFTPLHPWGDDTFVQWGKSGYGGFFIEAYPPGTYIARRGATLEEAEDRAWTQHQREIACSGHRWSPHQPGHGERLDGYGVCLDCGRHQADVLPVRTVCDRCGETVKLYSTRLCEPCHEACSDEELEHLEPTSAWVRRQGREMEAWRASRTPEQQAKEIIEALPAVLLAIAGDSGGAP